MSPPSPQPPDPAYQESAAQRREPLPEQELLRTTDQTSRYTVVGELGRGGMAVALRVFDNVMRRQLAMKVLSSAPDSVADDRQRNIAARFIDEARVTGGLDHPGIVPVYDLHADATGRVFFTMPIIEGADLLEVIERVHADDPEWTLGRAIGVVLKVCEAIAFAHSRGVLHRDLTPGNVRIGKFGEVHVIDWGLAKVLGHQERPTVEPPTGATDNARREPVAEGAPLTLDGTVLGTPAYMPPEQAEGRSIDVTPRSDVYAAGALLYHLLVGAAPYASRRHPLPPERILRLVRRGKPPAIERLNRKAPAELVAIAERAMARRPEDRYPEMNAMAADLRAYVEGRVVSTYERGYFARLRKLILRNRTVSLVVAVAVVAIVFNVVEFGISQFRHARLLETHSAELLQARDAPHLEAETPRGVVQLREQAAHRSACVASIERLRKALAAIPPDSLRHTDFEALLDELERAMSLR